MITHARKSVQTLSHLKFVRSTASALRLRENVFAFEIYLLTSKLTDKQMSRRNGNGTCLHICLNYALHPQMDVVDIKHCATVNNSLKVEQQAENVYEAYLRVTAGAIADEHARD